MTAIIAILCLELVIQILKIVVKRSIINKNVIDYYLEYMLTIILAITLFYQKNISANVLFVVLIISFVYEIISCIYMYYKYFKKENINDFSIKKVIDTSDFGILVLKGNKAGLINNTMYEILRELDIKKDYIENIKKCSKEQLNGNYVIEIKDNYYVFAINKNEIIAFDITEEYNLQNKLNEQNNKIKNNNNELILGIENIEELEREKNILKLKNKYHDILGQNLSVLQQYLNKQNISKESFEEIKFMINKMFIEIEDTEDSKVNLQNLIELHKNNGTNIRVTGKLPQNKEIAKVFFEIIREATTNAIKHAGSTNVFVEIKESLEETSMIIKNDGKKSNEFITENEGIKGMRRKVNKLNGIFYIQTLPQFSVNVLLKNQNN